MSLLSKLNNKSASSEFIFNLCSTFIQSGLVFLTMPIFTRLLGPEQFGKFAIFNSWMLIILCVACLKTHVTLGNAKYRFNEKYSEYRPTVFLLGLFINALMFLIAIIFLNTIANLLGFSELLVILLMINLVSHSVVECANNIYIYEKKASINFLIALFLAFSTVGLSLIFLTKDVFAEKYLSRVYGITIPYVIIAIPLAIVILKSGKIKYDKEFLKYSLILGVPIVIHSLSQNILGQADRIMLEDITGSGIDVGIYSFIHTYTSITSVIMSALNISWCPFYYDDLKSENWEYLKKKSQNYVELFTLILCGFLLLSREVMYLMADAAYFSGAVLIPVFVWVTFFIFIYLFAVNFEFYHRKSHFVAIATVVAGVTNIVLNYIFIPLKGMMGAAIATLIAYMVMCAMHYVFAHKIKEMIFPTKLRSFANAAGILLIATASFYVLKDFIIFRWILAFMIGGYELRKIIKRRAIF